MTRRNWVLTLGAGLCVSLAPACSPTRSQTVADNGSVEGGAPWAQSSEQPAAKPLTGSPYHPAGNPAAQASRPTDGQLEQTRYNAKPPGEELLPMPPSLPDAMARQTAAADTQPRAVPAAEMKLQPLPDPALISALRCYLDKRPAEALLWLDRYDRRSRDLLLDLLPVVARLAEASPSKVDSHELAAMVEQLNRVTALLRPRADLVIDKACFCERIYKFGVYKKLESDHVFHAGDAVEIYLEFQNLCNVRQGDFYGIVLASSLDIREEYRRVLFSHIDIPAGRTQADPSLSPRHDCFSRCSFQLPTTLPPGRYILDLCVTDVPTGRHANRSLEFQVGPGLPR